MTYTIYNNFMTFYFNMLANFYLCFNLVFPYYDDVIITLQKKSLINLYKNTSPAEIKRKRFITFLSDIYNFATKYKVFITDDNEVNFVKTVNDNDEESSENDSDVSEDSNIINSDASEDSEDSDDDKKTK